MTTCGWSVSARSTASCPASPCGPASWSSWSPIEPSPKSRGPRPEGRGPRDASTAPAGSGRAQLLLELAGRRVLVDLLDGGEFARQAVERRLVDLALAVGLVGLAGIAVQVA